LGGYARFNNTNTLLYYNDLWSYQLPCEVSSDFTINNKDQCLNGNNFLFTNSSRTNAGGLTYQWTFGTGTGTTSANASFIYPAAGTYKVKLVTSGQFCKDSIEKTVTLLQTEATVTASGATTICDGTTVVLKANSGNQLRYQWKKDGLEITGAIDSTLTVSSEGNYSVLVTNSTTNCNNESSPVTITILQRPQQPGGTSTQSFCNAGLVQNLTATGTNLKWYASASASTPLAAATGLVNGTTYFASQTVNGCESSDRFAVTVTINSTPFPSGNSLQIFCNGAVLSNLIATGTAIRWYETETGGSELANNTLLVSNKVYYASQTQNGCESQNRLPVSVLVTTVPAPAGASTQNFCNGALLQDLSVSGLSVKWYAGLTSTTVLGSSLPLTTATSYYATQTVNGCESDTRLAVAVTITPRPGPPAGLAVQNLCSPATIASLQVTGTSVEWFNVPVGGSSLNAAAPLISGNSYYAGQTVNGCSSSVRLSVVPVVTESPAQPSITVNGFELQSSAAIGNQWYRDNILLQGATGATYRPQQPGAYRVRVTNGTCISPFSEVVNFISGGGEYIRLYPNPVRDQLTVSWMLQNAIQLSATIISSQGQVLERIPVINSNQKLTIGHLQPGYYLLQLNTLDGAKRYVYGFMKIN
jgi:PKD repeat protein